MDILIPIARLLDYPTPALVNNLDAVCEAIRKSPYLPPDLRRNIIAEVRAAFAGDLYDIQSRYDSLFDRGRHHSLLLFEHLHGESRDRGQAMVDLLQIYEDAGFQLASYHLPDYLPLFLEFLSTQDDETAADWLTSVSHILLLLAERLRKSGAWEAILFDSLILITGQPMADDRIIAQVQAEDDDRTLKAIDEAWQDKEVRFDETFGEDNGCPVSVPISKHQPLEKNEQPLIWHKGTIKKTEVAP